MWILSRHIRIIADSVIPVMWLKDIINYTFHTIFSGLKIPVMIVVQGRMIDIELIDMLQQILRFSLYILGKAQVIIYFKLVNKHLVTAGKYQV
ncbi:hypothetical protein D3C73_1410200 [compost metagenome]